MQNGRVHTLKEKFFEIENVFQCIAQKCVRKWLTLIDGEGLLWGDLKFWRNKGSRKC